MGEYTEINRTRTKNSEDEELTDSSRLLPKQPTQKSCTFQINRLLLPVKLVYFLFFAATASLLPYLGIYFKQIGFSPVQIGALMGVRQFASCLCAPFWGWLADRFNLRRTLLLATTGAWLISLTVTGFLPTPDISESCRVTVDNTTGKLFQTTQNSTPYKAGFIPLVQNVTTSQLNYTKDSENIIQKKEEERGQQNDSWPFLPHRITTMSYDKLFADRSWMFTPESRMRIFGIAFPLVTFGEVVMLPALTLIDARTIDLLGVDNAHLYGRQRLWGAVGFGAAALIVGCSLYLTRAVETVCGLTFSVGHYKLAFVAFAGFVSLTLILETQISFDDTKTEQLLKTKHSLRKIVRIICGPHYGSVLFSAFTMGTSTGIIKGFLFWHLENLGATQLIVGLSTIVLGITEISTFLVISKLQNKIGYLATLHLSLFGFSVFFAVLSVLRNPWWALPIEVIEGLAFSAMWTSLIEYTGLALPPGSTATVQSIVHSVYTGLGLGVGTIIGGLSIQHFGALRTFQLQSAMNLVTLFLCVGIQRVAGKPKWNEESEEKQNNEE